MAGGSTLEDTSPDQRFGRIYGAYHLEIYGYLRRRTDADTARDASAETFLVLWRRLGDAPDGDGVRPWLYGVARKALANQQRAQRRFFGLRRKIANTAQDPPWSPTPESVVVRAAEIQEVDDAMGRLGSADQELLRLVAWEELSHEDIGVIVGCKPHAVDQRLLRARRRLEHELRHSDYAEQLNEWTTSTEAGGAS